MSIFILCLSVLRFYIGHKRECFLFLFFLVFVLFLFLCRCVLDAFSCRSLFFSLCFFIPIVDLSSASSSQLFSIWCSTVKKTRNNNTETKECHYDHYLINEWPKSNIARKLILIIEMIKLQTHHNLFLNTS